MLSFFMLNILKLFFLFFILSKTFCLHFLVNKNCQHKIEMFAKSIESRRLMRKFVKTLSLFFNKKLLNKLYIYQRVKILFVIFQFLKISNNLINSNFLKNYLNSFKAQSNKSKAFLNFYKFVL